MRGTRLGCLVALAGAAAACGPGGHAGPGEETITVSPPQVALLPGTSQRFTSAVSGTADGAVTWSVAEGDAGGTVDGDGKYTAPAAAGTYHVVATSRADTALSARATVVVTTGSTPEIAIDPSSATLDPGASQRFTAVVTGATDATVAWSVAEGGAGGRVDGGGTYTAPATAGTYHVVATSRADASLRASAEVTVRARPVVTVTISPPSVDVATGGSAAFTASVAGTSDGRVAWSVREGAAGGAVDARGAYGAPAAPGTFHVVATSVADATASAAATVTVHAPPVTVSIAPPSVEVPTGGVVRFTATVSGTPDGRVAWSVREGSAGGAVDANGGYGAPGSAGTFHVVATSVAEPSASAAATVTVTAPQATVTISPERYTVVAGGTIYFMAWVNGVQDNSAVIWSVTEGAKGGAVDGTGTYVAPLTAGTYHVVATSRAAPTASATATVTVPRPSDLYDRGGQVLPSPHVYAIWWGDRAAFGDAIGALEHLFRSVSGTQWLGNLDQYMRGGGHASVTFAGSLFDPSAPPTTGAAGLPDEMVCGALDAAGLAPDPTAIYFVYFLVPSVATFSAPGFHYAAICHGVSIPTAVQIADGHAWNVCGGGLSDDAAWLATITTHELAEAMTDPFPWSGWADANFQELGDKCSLACGTFGGTNIMAAGLWSNSLGSCVGP